MTKENSMTEGKQHDRGKIAKQRQNNMTEANSITAARKGQRQTSKTVTKQHDSGNVATLQRQSSMPKEK